MAQSPRRSFLRLFLILSLSALFLLSLYCSSSTSNLPPQFASSFPQNPTCNSTSFDDNYANNFTLTIKVLTFDRLVSLSRCLRSLANAQYGHDTVNLHIFVDHFKVTENRTEELDHRLNESRRILEFVDGFSWKFGEKIVHYRTGNVGLQAQWLEAWWPSSDHEFAFVVEDDLEVSPLYYKFLRSLILNYYYNSSNFHPSIYGASLQRPRFVPGKHGNKLQLDSGTSLFLYQLVGTWGQLLFPRPWKEFRLWYDSHKVKGIKPFLQGMVTTGWYKKMGERIWTPWFIKFIQSHGYYNIYTYFSHERALSMSHRDAGVNYGRTAGPDSFLLDENSLNLDLLEMPPLSKLKWYDFCFAQVFPGRVVRSVDELGSVLHSLKKLETIVLVSLHGVPHSVTRNLLCHFERLNIRNYILVGRKSDFLLDLARRGHPVIDADQFLDNIQVQKLKPFKESGLDLAKEILVKAFVVKKTLELGYSTWVVDENMLAVSSDSFSVSADPSYDFYVGKTFKALFIRSSSSAKENWADDFIYKVLTMVDPFKHKDIFPVDGRNFVSIVAEVLKQEGVKIGTIDAMGFDATVSATNVNQSSLGDEKKVVYWSSEIHLDFLAKQLESLGFWIIDGDSSCTAVVCHES